jgi:hypothetical protein
MGIFFTYLVRCEDCTSKTYGPGTFSLLYKFSVVPLRVKCIKKFYSHSVLNTVATGSKVLIIVFRLQDLES